MSSDYEVKNEPKEKRPYTTIHGASKQLADDIHNSIDEGVSYGEYMWRKQAREDEAYLKKYGRKRVRK